MVLSLTLLLPADCVPFSRHAGHASDREDAQRRSDVEDFCCGGLRYEYVGSATLLSERVHGTSFLSFQSKA